MKKNLTLLIVSIIFFAACRKEAVLPAAPQKIIAESCLFQSIDAGGRSYSTDSVESFNCTSSFCGLMPLNSKNYWVYEDSIFNYGTFVRVQYDTMRFTKAWRSHPDGLVWWESNLKIGLPEKLYTNDSAFFKLENRLFTPGFMDAKKDFSLFPGDSLRYLASFEDAAAQGRSVKLNTPISTIGGIFEDLILFEKNARNYRRDQVYFKPGFGVIRYIMEKAPMGSPIIKLQQVSTLVAFHIE